MKKYAIGVLFSVLLLMGVSAEAIPVPPKIIHFFNLVIAAFTQTIGEGGYGKCNFGVTVDGERRLIAAQIINQKGEGLTPIIWRDETTILLANENELEGIMQSMLEEALPILNLYCK